MIPTAAQAKVKTVYMGVPPSAQKTLNDKLNSDVNDFFPHSISVRVGQNVRFDPSGFHTVDFPTRGARQLPLISATGTKLSGVMDAAGNPFWFNGQDQLGFTPALGKMLYGKSVVYDGTKRVESGLPFANHPKPFTVRFTKTGDYTYYCDVHPGMKGVVHVKSARARVASVAADTKAIERQVSAAEKQAKRNAHTIPPTGVVYVGSSGPHGVETYSFFPSAVTVPIGTTLQFKMSPNSYDVHTATTGPGDPMRDSNSYLGKLAASINSPVFDPAAVYPSDPPPNLPSLTPAAHGNGFWNTGVMDTSPQTSRLNSSGSVRFDAPGTYEFYCLIHPFMHATVTVQ
ncbi:hypothetical protein FSW04_01465 [Baekduia soli]|uniref:Blue (type 1) copper domain-containing protein n=1 Tax=Baekduia soli TaxID=496014 RepID=A0A5B8U077_9ACTN|nr:hypothetical protein [Baekduia soli]QEC46376.1 hypothetical protein FSW04_01465 [Baekduia soli]